VETFADDRAIGIENDGAHAWVGVAKRSALSKLDGTTHERDVALVPRRVDLAVSHVLPLVLDSCSGELRGANGEHRSWQAQRARRVHAAGSQLPVHAVGPQSHNDLGHHD